MATSKGKTSKPSSSFSSKHREKAKVSRPGVHAKTKTSKNKQSRNYKKLSRGQG
jgi:hypothetical protein